MKKNSKKKKILKLGWKNDLQELEIEIMEQTKQEIPQFIKFSIKYISIPILSILLEIL